LISEIESICDEVIFISKGNIVLKGEVEEIREEKGKSIDGVLQMSCNNGLFANIAISLVIVVCLFTVISYILKNKLNLE